MSSTAKSHGACSAILVSLVLQLTTQQDVYLLIRLSPLVLAFQRFILVAISFFNAHYFYPRSTLMPCGVINERLHACVTPLHTSSRYSTDSHARVLPRTLPHGHCKPSTLKLNTTAMWPTIHDSSQGR